MFNLEIQNYKYEILEIIHSLHLHADDQLLLKANKLITFFYSTVNSPIHKNDFDCFMKFFNIEEKSLLKSFLEYNLDIFQDSGNTIYHSIENRIVLHIHNLIIGSWHTDRQNQIIKILTSVQPNTVVDIGFGVPSAYIKQIVLNQTFPITLTLADLYDSAFLFGVILLDLWNVNWKKYINFKKTNMDIEEYVGDYNLYLFQDSIEHTLRPSTYLEKYVKYSPDQALFLLSLPIGPLFPRHTIAWKNEEEALRWVNNCGLNVTYSEKIYVNPKIDLFAEQLGNSFHDLVLLCEKRK